MNWWVCGICGQINDPDHVYCSVCHHADKSFEPCSIEWKTIEGFRRQLRAIVRSFFREEMDGFNFADIVSQTIETAYHEAFVEGAATCGVSEDELTDAELETIREMALTDASYIFGLARAVREAREAGLSEEEAFTSLYARLELWVNRYNALRVQGGAMACANDKRTWVLGPTEEHCRSCGGFQGRVYRYVVWASNGAIPQSRSLACQGWRCLCDLPHTDAPITRGRFPASLLG